MVFECLKGLLWRLGVGTVIIKHYSIIGVVYGFAVEML
jgi:hypothetical protein